jgi:cytochrome c-type biogenesis protein CcmH
VTEEAETAFKNTLAVELQNVVARFFIGLARAQHKDTTTAIALWQNLLADIPVTDPMHQMLVDRLVVLTSQSVAQGQGTAPNPRAMVAMLAARLKADPHDALGWVRLMRAYTVLGEKEKVKQALSDARKAFPDNKDAQTAFTTAAKALKLA